MLSLPLAEWVGICAGTALCEDCVGKVVFLHTWSVLLHTTQLLNLSSM